MLIHNCLQICFALSSIHMYIPSIQALSSSPSGYVLMVEGGRIDHAHHLNQAKKAVEETLELERAVLAALELTRRGSVPCNHEVTLIQRYQERELLTTMD